VFEVQPLNPPSGVRTTEAVESIIAVAGNIHVLTNFPFKYKSKVLLFKDTTKLTQRCNGKLFILQA
jgi:hypothetical protein